MIDKEYLNWKGLDLFTTDFKEWILSLFRKAHARMGHIEEDLIRTRYEMIKSYVLKSKITSSGVQYDLIEETTKTNCGSIIVSTEGGVNVTTWEEDIN